MENTEEKGPVEIPLSPFAAVFFLSGAAALVYQVVWQRILVFFTGADVYASTVIVAVFMAGLGVGALAGGRVADRLSPRMSALLFAGAEIGIAAFSLVSRPLFYDVLTAGSARSTFRHLETPAVYTPGFDRSSLLDFNSDLCPRDEFDLSGGR